MADANKTPKNIDTFDRWFRQDGHWVYPSREKALSKWLRNGIEGLPNPR